MTGTVLGALCAHLLTAALGLIVLRALRIQLDWNERWGASMACGLPLVVLLVHGLAAVHGLRRGLLQLLAAGLCGLAFWLTRNGVSEAARVHPVTWLPAAPFLIWALLQAVGPDSTPVGEDAALSAAHRLVSGLAEAGWDAGAVYAVPYLIGRHSAVALFHASLLLPLAAGLGRFGWLAVLLAVANPALLSFGARGGCAVAFSLSAFAAVGLGALAFHRRQWRYVPTALAAATGAWLCWPGPLDSFTGFVFLKSPWWLAPFLAIGAAWLVSPFRSAAAVLAIFAALTGWPTVTSQIAPKEARPTGQTGFVEARFLEVLPRGAVVLSDVPMPGAWVPRRLAPPEWLGYARRVAAAQWGVRTLPFRTGRDGEASLPGFLGEVLVYSQGKEIPRSPRWRVWPPEAFDGLPFTGAQGPIRIDTGGDAVEVELRIIGDQGELWVPPVGLRRNVVQEWKRRGVTHVLTHDPLLIAELTYQGEFWGVSAQGERNGAWLYELK